ncbi:MAG: calcium-binding protein, partial [Betaproteobacteria bacterium]|nr:calcium-binding protein [Betaproteobacteria bacterium]
ATITVPIASDQTTEGSETLTVTVVDKSASVLINDTSLSPPPTYQVIASSSSVDEGSIAVFTVETTNVTAGSSLTYTLSGVSASDVVGGSLSGSVVVGANGKASISIPLAADQLTEGDETLTLSIQGKNASVTVRDTSKAASSSPLPTPGDDSLTGSSSNDTIDGLAGNDTLKGAAGNDSLIGGTGNDKLYGEDGDDTLVGSQGDDFLFGGNGLDTAEFLLAFDNYSVTPLYESKAGLLSGYEIRANTGSEGIDTVSTDIEYLSFGPARYTLVNGTVQASATAANDSLSGSEGNDTIDGLAGNDTIRGAGGDDWLEGGPGNDELYGDAGDDSLEGSGGDDRLSGGDGSDTAIFIASRATYTVRPGINDEIVVRFSGSPSLEGADILVQMEWLQFADQKISASIVHMSAIQQFAGSLYNV